MGDTVGFLDDIFPKFCNIMEGRKLLPIGPYFGMVRHQHAAAIFDVQDILMPPILLRPTILTIRYPPYA